MFYPRMSSNLLTLYLEHINNMSSVQSKNHLKKVLINYHSANKHLFGPIQRKKKPRRVQKVATYPQEKEAGYSKNIYFGDKELESFSNVFKYHNTHNHLDSVKIETTAKQTVAPNVASSTSKSHPYKVHGSPNVSDTSDGLVSPSSFWFPLFPDSSLEGVADWDSIVSHHDFKPGVTRVLQETMPEGQKKALEIWKNNMIKKLGKDGFMEYQKNLLDRGKTFHNFIHHYLLSDRDSEVPEPPVAIAKHWKSVQNFVSNIHDVVATETRLVHPRLNYQGVIDCVANYKDTLLLIDWKLSEKPKAVLNSLYDAPLQVSAYLGALNFDKNFANKVEKAALIVAYDSGFPAHIHVLSRHQCEFYWKHWLNRLYSYFKQQQEEPSL